MTQGGVPNVLTGGHLNTGKLSGGIYGTWRKVSDLHKRKYSYLAEILTDLQTIKEKKKLFKKQKPIFYEKYK